jgi:hypothetical protein
MPLVHELKTWPGHFQHILDGTKTFDFRRDDRGFMPGDTVLLREYDPRALAGMNTLARVFAPESVCYTGRTVTRRIGFVLKGDVFGHPLGEYAILSLVDPSEGERESAVVDFALTEVERQVTDALKDMPETDERAAGLHWVLDDLLPGVRDNLADMA